MNIRAKILIFLLSLSMMLYGLHTFALRANLYWTTSWADSVTHTIGGGILACILFYFISFKDKFCKIKLSKAIGFAFVVGVLWELFELLTHQTFYGDRGYLFDTLGDLFFDIFGAYLAHLFLTETLDE